MVIWHAQRKRKVGGSKYKRFRDKRKRELGKHPANTKLSESKKVITIRTRGAHEKTRLLRSDIATVFNSKTKKYQKAKIKKIVENNANRHFARMSVMTKGAIIETDIGKARITNRPGQTGVINAVLIE